MDVEFSISFQCLFNFTCNLIKMAGHFNSSQHKTINTFNMREKWCQIHVILFVVSVPCSTDCFVISSYVAKKERKILFDCLLCISWQFFTFKLLKIFVAVLLSHATWQIVTEFRFRKWSCVAAAAADNNRKMWEKIKQSSNCCAFFCGNALDSVDCIKDKCRCCMT